MLTTLTPCGIISPINISLRRGVGLERFVARWFDSELSFGFISVPDKYFTVFSFPHEQNKQQQSLTANHIFMAGHGCCWWLYLCTHGHTPETWTFLPASPFWISAPRNLILAPNETGILNCRVSGEPKPKITWSINGMPIDSEYHVDSARPSLSPRLVALREFLCIIALVMLVVVVMVFLGLLVYSGKLSTFLSFYCTINHCVK